MTNVLMEKSSLDYEAFPFNNLDNSQFLPSLKTSIEMAKAKLEKIKEIKEPTFENTVVELEFIDAELNQVSSVFYNLHHAEKTDEIQNIAEEFSALITAYGNDVALDSKLFSQIQKVWDKRQGLKGEDLMLLEKTYKGFVREGANLNDEQKEKLRAIDTELADKKIKFSDNLLKATNSFFMHITDESKLKGLPESALEAASEEAKERKLEGWVFTLHYPSFMPFMTYAENRELRQKIYMAFATRAYKGEFDNRELAKRIANLSY